MDSIPIAAIFAATILLVMLSNEAGHKLGRAVRRRTPDEKEASASAIAGSILGLTAFMLAFTFGIVANRYDARRALVRDEANAIGSAYLRTDFLAEPDRAASVKLLRDYVDARLVGIHVRDVEKIQQAVKDSVRIQKQLWDIAVANARKDMNSDIGALYVESLNSLMDVHSLRVAIALQVRISNAIWLVLYALVVLGMIGMGYQTAIAGSPARSWMTLLLAFSFSLVILLIVALDRTQSGLVTISQQPLVDLRASMDEK